MTERQLGQRLTRLNRVKNAVREQYANPLSGLKRWRAKDFQIGAKERVLGDAKLGGNAANGVSLKHDVIKRWPLLSGDGGVRRLFLRCRRRHLDRRGRGIGWWGRPHIGRH